MQNEFLRLLPLENPEALLIMKSKYLRALFSFGLVFFLGVGTGAVIQKTIGVGNVLRAIGIPYPTAGVPTPAADLQPIDVPEAYRGTMALFILAGQSNMSGGVPVPTDGPMDPRVYVFGNDYHWRIAREPIDSSDGQVDRVSEDPFAGFSPSLAFALESLNHRPQIVIGLIPCAKSSSAILQWQRNLSEQSLYGSCLKRARAASPMGHLAGILFFQGEADALRPDVSLEAEPKALEWSELFSTFVADFRHDLEEPDLPVVFAELGERPTPEGFVNWELVKNQQRSVQMPMVTMIVTEDLPYHDGLHFTVDSYRTIGNRFAEAYWSLVETSPGH